MKVKEWMTTKVKTCGKSLPLIEAWRIFHDYEFRHLPVVEGDRLIGIISKRDLGRRVLEKLPMTDLNELGIVASAMSKEVITVGPDDDIRKAAVLMHNQKIGAVPVIEEGDRLVGILSVEDLLEVLLSVFDLREKA